MRSAAIPRRPVLQAVMMLQAESFVCRRCRTDYTISHEKFDSPYHFHPEIEIILLENSRGTRYVAESIEPYASGDFVMIGANVPHVFVRDRLGRREAREPETSIVLHFRADWLGETFLARPELRDIRRLIADAGHGLHFDASVARWASQRLHRLLVLQGARRIAVLLELLDRLARERGRPLSAGAVERPLAMNDGARLDRVLAHVARHFSRDLSLESVARVAALRPTSFSRWFRQSTSKSFVEYVTEIRLGQAYRLLSESGRSITEIALECGFTSLSHFIHRFQAARGMSPGEYRRRTQDTVAPKA